jgi:AcrR family transcriptional regulator
MPAPFWDAVPSETGVSFSRTDGTSGGLASQMALVEPSEPGLRERKKAATQALLRETALSLFSERGFAAVSVDEIATGADVSRSTFFRYFGSKESVLFDEIDETGDVFLKHLNERPPNETPWEAFEKALIATSEPNVGDEQRNQQQRMLDELLRTDPALHGRRRAMIERWTDVLAAVFARREGRTEPGLEDRLAASTCMAVSDELGRVWRESPGESATDIIANAFATLRSF